MIYCNSAGDVAVSFSLSSENEEIRGIFDDDSRISDFFGVFLEHIKDECEVCKKGGAHENSVD